MGGTIWLVLIVVLAGIIGSVVYFDQQYLVDDVIAYTYSSFIEISKKFPDGSDLSHFIPDQPVDQKAKPVKATSIINENSTEVEKTVAKAIEQATTPVSGVPQYKKLDPKGIPITGHAILVDSISGQHLKPYIYNVVILIQCDDERNRVDGFNFCNTENITSRVQTIDAGIDTETKEILGGFYEYLWRPNDSAVSTGFYDVTVYVTTDELDQKGTYKLYEDKWKIQVI